MGIRIQPEPEFAIEYVVATRERNMYDDSDFFATYWDVERKAFVEIEYATTRAWSYENYAKVDAPEEIQAAYQQWLIWERKVDKKVRLMQLLENPHKGAKVVVARGRKIPKGTEAVVIGDVRKVPSAWSRLPNAMCQILFGKEAWMIKAEYLDVVEPAAEMVAQLAELEKEIPQLLKQIAEQAALAA